MVFSSPVFLFVFLPLTLIGYYAALAATRSRTVSNAFLLLASLFFYLWGGGPLTALLIGVIALNFAFGLAAERYPARRRWLLAGALIANLGILGVFKYANFAAAQLSQLMVWNGGEALDWRAIALPIGISFYVFQAISYQIDRHTGAGRTVRNPFNFALYIAMFPQLIAGPIVRFAEIDRQLSARKESLSGLSAGAARFTHGLFKKVVIADSAAPIADAAFADPVALSAGDAWIGLIAYTIQIYFDFSGYSDMAIGLGRMFGFKFPENFMRPYSAVSITDFWRRWHMTLSRFFRDYVYIPLGGSRGSAQRTYINLIGVFLLTGLWHGAAWTFVAWGVYHGALLLIERAFGWRRMGARLSLPALIAARAGTLILVMLGWALFRAESIGDAMAYYGSLFGMGDAPIASQVQFLLGRDTIALMILGAASALLPGHWAAGRRLSLASGPLGRPSARALTAAYVLAAAAICFLAVNAQSYSPFIYFQF